MLLEDNKPLYAALRVSSRLVCSSFPHCLQRCIHDLGDMAGLDCSITWPRQPKEKISKIIAAVGSFEFCHQYLQTQYFMIQARERQPYFKRFAHGWAIEEFLKSQLKNRRSYARKHGYLQDIANVGVDASDDDSDKVSENENAGDEDEVEDEVDVNGFQEEPENESINDGVSENQSYMILLWLDICLFES